MLKEKPFKDYLIIELDIEEFITIMDSWDNNYRQAQLTILSKALCDPKTREPIGREGLKKIGASEFMEVWQEVGDMHGLTAKKDESATTNT
jgi:hypothetical protein